jgi:phosphatidylglycerophosphate synthase
VWLTIPNTLSLFRLFLGLAFAWLPEPWRPVALVAGVLSDAVDGSLGRATGTAGGVGRALDPIADKVFVAGVAVTLVADGGLTVWQFALLALRDIAVGVRAGWVLVRRDRAGVAGFRPTALGKLATALQFLALLDVLLRGTATPPLFVATALVSGLAGLDYLLRPRPVPAEPPGHTSDTP